jgi:hypothetical protein
MRISSKPGYFFRSLGKSVNGDGLALLLRTGDVPISIVEEGIELVRRADLIGGGLIRLPRPGRTTRAGKHSRVFHKRIAALE